MKKKINIPRRNNTSSINFNEIDSQNISVSDTGIVNLSKGNVYYDNKPPKVELIKNGDFEIENPELITNGDFSNGLTDWTVEGARSYATIVNGALNSNNTNAGNWYAEHIEQDISFVNGTTYKVTFKAKNISGGLNLRITQNANVIASLNLTSSFVDYTYSYTANLTGGSIRLFCNGAVGQFEIDSVSVKEVGGDWSLGGGWAIGSNVATHNGSTNANISQNVPLVVGTAYDITYTVVNASAGSKIGIAPDSLNIQYPRTYDGTYTETFTASLTNLYIRSLWNNGNPVSIDNISLSRKVLETEYSYFKVLIKDEYGNLTEMLRNSNIDDVSELGIYVNNQSIQDKFLYRRGRKDGMQISGVDYFKNPNYK